jgi:hypothetical protein
MHPSGRARQGDALGSIQDSIAHCERQQGRGRGATMPSHCWILNPCTDASTRRSQPGRMVGHIRTRQLRGARCSSFYRLRPPIHTVGDGAALLARIRTRPCSAASRSGRGTKRAAAACAPPAIKTQATHAPRLAPSPCCLPPSALQSAILLPRLGAVQALRRLSRSHPRVAVAPRRGCGPSAAV